VRRRSVLVLAVIPMMTAGHASAPFNVQHRALFGTEMIENVSTEEAP